jgi:UDP-glucuronate 4-epimerase
VVGALDHPPAQGEHRLLNIGDDRPVGLLDMIGALERALGCSAEKLMRPMQPGDVTGTWANIDRLRALTGYRPKVPVEEGLQRFARWYLDYHGDDQAPGGGPDGGVPPGTAAA